MTFEPKYNQHSQFYQDLKDALRLIISDKNYKFELVDLLLNPHNVEHVRGMTDTFVNIIKQAVEQNPDNVAAHYLQIKAEHNYRESTNSANIWYRVGVTVPLPEDLADDVLNSNDLGFNIGHMVAYYENHPEVVFADGEVYSPEGCVSVSTNKKTYQYMWDEH